MRSLLEYINEEYEKFQIQELTVKFGVERSYAVFEQPESYLEDNMMIYLQDTVIDKSFVGPEFIEDFFGKNSERLDDTYFEYSGFEKTSDTADMKFDTHYDDGKAKDEKMQNMKYKDFFMVLTFTKFEMLDTDKDNLEEALTSIFERCVSDEYKWPIKFTFDPDNIEYK